MERKNVDGMAVYVTQMPVTPSVIGVLQPKIIIPEIMWKEYDQD